MGISEYKDFHQSEIQLEKTREIDNEVRISEKAEMKKKFNKNQKRITPWDFSNDENARPPTLLKTESITDILIKQIHNLQNSYFKGQLRKDFTVLQKALPLKLTATLNPSIVISSFLNFV